MAYNRNELTNEWYCYVDALVFKVDLAEIPLASSTVLMVY